MKRDPPRAAANRASPESAEHASLEALVEIVVGAAYEVSNVLGAGFLEKVYERALMQELRLRDIEVQSQVSFPISCKGEHVGHYVAHLVAGHEVLVELKCVDHFTSEHTGMCINYLKASH